MLPNDYSLLHIYNIELQRQVVKWKNLSLNAALRLATPFLNAFTIDAITDIFQARPNWQTYSYAQKPWWVVNLSITSRPGNSEHPPTVLWLPVYQTRCISFRWQWKCQSTWGSVEITRTALLQETGKCQL